MPEITCVKADDPDLVRVRQYGNPAGGANAINYAEACKDGSRGLNCRGLATVLNECYLSLGIPSRVITCMPRIYINDCHVINAVYSSTLGKWLWIDPTNNAWVTDEKYFWQAPQ